MGLLQKFVLDVIGEYIPGLDKEQLRINVATGTCSVNNVDCTPGLILALSNFPFHLTSGHIGNLEVKVPWAAISSAPVRVTAKNVSFNFEEIPFPSNISEVVEAIKGSKRRTKLRVIAERERRTSFAWRILQKFLPIILNRVEIDLRNIEISLRLAAGHCIRFRVGELTTLKNLSEESEAPSSSLDFAKCLSARDISLDISHSRSQEGSVTLPEAAPRKSIFAVSRFELGFTLRNGTLNVDWNISSSVFISFNEILLEALLSLKNVSTKWHSAVISSSLDPPSFSKAWFRYAVHAVLLSRNRGGAEPGLLRGLDLKRICVEYKDLNVKRLARKDRLQPCDKVRLAELEEQLDVDTILLLRNQARKEVIVDEAANFQSDDFLSRWLFGHHLSQERELITEEIRQSIESLENVAQSLSMSKDEPMLESLPTGNVWSRAVINVYATHLEFSVGENTSSVNFSADNVKIWLEMDSAMSSYAGYMTIEDIALLNAGSSLLQRRSEGKLADLDFRWPQAADDTTSSGESLVTLRVKKTALDRASHVDLRVLEFQLHLDFDCYSPLMWFATSLKKCYGLRELLMPKDCNEDNNHRPVSAEVVGDASSEAASSSIARHNQLWGPSSLPSLRLEIAGCRATIPLHIEQELTSSSQREAIVLDFGKTFCELEGANGCLTGSVKTLFNLSSVQIRGPGVQGQAQGSRNSSRIDSQIAERCLIHVSVNPGCLSVMVGTSVWHLSKVSARALTVAVKGLCGQLLNLRDISFMETYSQDRIENLKSSSVPEEKFSPVADEAQFFLSVERVTIHVRGDDSFQSLTVDMKSISYRIEASESSRLTVRDVAVRVGVEGVALQIHPTTHDEDGLTVVAKLQENEKSEIDHDQRSKESTNLSISFGSTAVLLSCNNVVRLTHLIREYAKVIHNSFRAARSNEEFAGLAAMDSREDNGAAYMPFAQISVCARVTYFELMMDDVHALWRAESFNFVVDETKYGGSCETMELLDLSGRSGKYCTAVQCVGHGSLSNASEGCFSFLCEKNRATIHIAALHIVLLRSFLDELSTVCSRFGTEASAFVNDLENIYSARNGSQSCCEESRHDAKSGFEESDSWQKASPASENRGNVVLFLTSLKVTAPAHPFSYGAARLLLPEVKATFSSFEQEIMLKRCSLLTRVSRSGISGSTSSQEHGHIAREWRVLLRSVDFHLGHKSHSTPSPTVSRAHGNDIAMKVRKEWSIQVLSRMNLLVAPSQICLLQSVLSRLLTQTIDSSISAAAQTLPNNDFDSHGATGCSKAMEQSDPLSDSSIAPKVEHISIVATTEGISIDLLEEGDQGLVVASIASISSEPLWFSSETILETNADNFVTYVTRSRLDILGLWLEDQRKEVSPEQELVLVVQSNLRAVSASSDSSATERSGSSFRVEVLTRRDSQSAATMSTNIYIIDPQILLSPDLIFAISSFVFESLSGGDLEKDGSTASSGTIIESADEMRHGEETYGSGAEDGNTAGANAQSGARETTSIVSKLSISLVRPRVFVQDIRSKKKGCILDITAVGLKASLFFDHVGAIVAGSAIRARKIEVRMPDQEVFSNGEDGNASPDAGYEVVTVSTDQHALRSTGISSSLRFALSGGNLSNNARKRPVLYAWGSRLYSAPFVARISALTVKFPTAPHSAVRIAMLGINIESSLQALIRFICFVPYLYVLPESQVGDDSGVAPMELSVRALSIHVQFSPHSDVSSDRDAYRIRIRSVLRVCLGRDVSFVSVQARLSADVLNELSGTRDQLLVPFDLEGNANLSSSQLSITIPKSLQVTISPLTVKTVFSSILEIRRYFHRGDEDCNHHFGDPAPVSFESTGSPDTIQFIVSIRGVVTSLVAEEPRAQLMRLVFRDITALGKWPLVTPAWGHIALSIGDVLLEDVISWHVYGNFTWEEDDIEWTTLFSTANDLSAESSTQSLINALVPSRLSAAALEIRRGLQTPGRDYHGLDIFRASEAHKKEIDRVSSELSRQVFSPEGTGNPNFLSATCSWEAPSQHIAVHITFSGLDLRLNSTVLPSLVGWTTSVIEAAEETWAEFHEEDPNAGSYFRPSKVGIASNSLNVESFVIEGLAIRLATRAPPRPIEQSALRRLLDWLVGSECMSGLTIRTPRISFRGEFANFRFLLAKIRSEYLHSLASRAMIRQLLLQMPALSVLTRVGARTVLRRDRFLAIDSLVSSSNSSLVSDQISHGLAAAFSASCSGSAYNQSLAHSDARNSRGVFTRLQPLQQEARDLRSLYDGGSVEIEEITESICAGRHDKTTEGRELFLNLRAKDEGIPKDEKYELFATFRPDTALMVTSTYILFIDRGSLEIRPPRILRSSVSRFDVDQACVKIRCLLVKEVPLARSAARLYSRDTSALASAVTERVHQWETITYEVKCETSEYAQWLKDRLPLPVAYSSPYSTY